MSADRFRGLIILDSGLRAERGHHANFTRLVLHEAAARRWSTALYSNRSMSEHLRDEFSPVQHFTTSPYDLPHVDEASPLRADMANFVTLNDAFEQELRALSLHSSDRDLILVPTITHNQLLGMARWLASPDAPVHGHVAVMLLFSPGWEALGTSKDLAEAMYHVAFNTLKHVPVSQLTLFAETQPMAESYTTLAQRPVHVAPWPTAEPNLARLAMAPSNDDTVTVGYLGYAKPERGIHLLPQIIAQTSDACSRFFVQIDTFLPETVSKESQSLQDMGTAVTVHHGSLPRMQFLKTLSAMDIVLMPYDPTAYRHRGSALFSEAAMLGRIVVVPARTWMSQQAEANGLGYVSFDSFDAQSIAAAVNCAIEQRASLRAAAQDAAKAWRDDRTAAAFLDRICVASGRASKEKVASSCEAVLASDGQ